VRQTVRHSVPLSLNAISLCLIYFDLLNTSFGTARAYYQVNDKAAHSNDERQPKF